MEMCSIYLSLYYEGYDEDENIDKYYDPEDPAGYPYGGD